MVRSVSKISSKTGVEAAMSFSLLTNDDLHLFNEGNHFHLYEKMGAHRVEVDGVAGTYFSVWAPNAKSIDVVGDFNGWQKGKHPLRPKQQSGIWEGFFAGVEKGNIYKYFINSHQNNYRVEKADPFAKFCEKPPKTGSIIWDTDYSWGDHDWMEQGRKRHDFHSSPVSIYEMHLGSWMRKNENEYLTYLELAPVLTDYLKKMHFTHVEFLPVMEHPFYASWGYQCTGYFAPTSRYGTPEEFMFLIDHLHQNNIGVILDWVPSHFAVDEFALGLFDGTHIYEHADDRQGFHPDWGSHIFNYGRNEIASFLISNAFYWMDVFHIDGLRVDAVASMLYLDYSREHGEWVPNIHGGRENLEAIDFLRKFNEQVYGEFPHAHTIAEESTDWPMVSKPTYVGGLGFGMKWDMGWMHDTLEYMKKDPVHRKFHHDHLTFRMLYAYHENFILPLSHDEVVHGKSSLIGRMPGDDWQKFANLRLLFGHMFAQPGKKLLFMGGEFGQWSEWNHDQSLDWHLLEYPNHKGVQHWIKCLNQLYVNEPALFENEFSHDGFEWIDCSDSQQCILVLIRKGKDPDDKIIIALNFTPVPRMDYRIGVPCEGTWKEVLNSDAKEFGGGGVCNPEPVQSELLSWHGRHCSINVVLPPLAAIFLKYQK
ncbi:MAG: 1,4-alpha-glucan branching protein GlgB [Nitrospinae bacterium]|nr:1,4-alpha-glucan branching protein GlgB [Nitrospinota bacterium]